MSVEIRRIVSENETSKNELQKALDLDKIFMQDSLRNDLIIPKSKK